MPYKLPLVMSGEAEISSVCVHYPDIPEFKSALLGALTFFTKWVAWERDEENRAKIAADLWYRAHLLTLASWDNACEGCEDMPTIEDIREVIAEELENMTINNCINVNCGCGGSLGSLPGSGVDTLPPEDYEQPELPPLDEPEAPNYTESYAQYKCNRSHQLFYTFRTEVILKLDGFKNNSGLNFEDVSATIGYLSGGVGVVALLVWEIYYAIVNWLISRVNQSGAVIAQELDRHYDAFVCGVFSADGVNAAREAWYDALDGLALDWASIYYLKLLSQSIVWENWLYDENWDSYDFPDSFANRDCACGEGGITPIPDEAVFFTLHYTFDTGDPDWGNWGDDGRAGVSENRAWFNPRSSYGDLGSMYITANALSGEIGYSIGDSVHISNLAVTYRKTESGSKTLEFHYLDDSDQTVVTELSPAAGSYQSDLFVLDGAMHNQASSIENAIRIYSKHNGSDSPTEEIYVDDMTITGYYVPSGA